MKQKATQRVFTWREIRDLEGYWASDEDQQTFRPNRYRPRYDEWVKHMDQFKFKLCSVCGGSMAINNYEDFKSRTPQYRGLAYCGRCKPTSQAISSAWTTTKRMKRMYKILQILGRRSCFRQGDQDCKCLPCTSRRLLEIDPLTITVEVRFKIALVISLLSRAGCLKDNQPTCKCIACAARKMFPKDGSFGQIQV